MPPTAVAGADAAAAAAEDAGEGFGVVTDAVAVLNAYEAETVAATEGETVPHLRG